MIQSIIAVIATRTCATMNPSEDDDGWMNKKRKYGENDEKINVQ
jgi:hypothetical protein